MTHDSIRNVAIIAHVDHGKTTLVDQLLKQSGMFRVGELDKLAGGQHGLIMDSNPLERERGITILSKNCAIEYLATDARRHRINIIDTPGHADFGGEVERVLRMADGCLLVVDAFDGPMPQTRYVLGKALELGLRPVVVVNKCDRPDARPQHAVNEVFSLLIDLNADHLAEDFPVVYCSARDGWATHDYTERGADMRPVFDAIIRHVPQPTNDATAPLQMLVNTLDYSEYVGRIGIGRVFAGVIKSGQQVAVLEREGGARRNGKVVKLLRFSGLGRVETDVVEAGDLCAWSASRTSISATPSPTPTTRRNSRREGRRADHLDALPNQRLAFSTGRRLRHQPPGQGQTRTRTPEQRRAPRRARTRRRRVHGLGRGVLHLGILIENMRARGTNSPSGSPSSSPRTSTASPTSRWSASSSRRRTPPSDRSWRCSAPARRTAAHGPARRHDPHGVHRPGARAHRPPRAPAHRDAGRGDPPPHLREVRPPAPPRDAPTACSSPPRADRPPRTRSSRCPTEG